MTSQRKRQVLFGTAAILALLAFVAITVANRWGEEGVRLATEHLRFERAHQGWSFPARVETTSPTLAELGPTRRIAEARARGYKERCTKPGPGPGEYCARTGAVVPRGADAARLEPIVLGWLVGPDGEIREHLPLTDAPKHLIDAIIVAEDREYRTHGGVNLTAVARAVFQNARQAEYAQGGSTLTMQLVRAFAQRKEKTMTRKLKEAVMARAVDQALGKDAVLGAYLDAPYLGQRGGLSICGFRAAARHYFGKDVKEIDLAEAATLAAILPGPGRFAPDRFPERAKERRDRVLRAMGELMAYDVKDALTKEVRTVSPESLSDAHPAYLSAVRAYMEDHLDPATLFGAGLVITAAIDLPMQVETDKLFAEKLAFYATLLPRRPGEPLQSAAVMIDSDDGRLRAIYGGTDVTSTGFNRALMARRQGGSAFKPVVYALALESGKYTAATPLKNAYRVFKTPDGDWRPKNVSGEYSPTASLAYAITWSQNVATASLLEALGGPKPLIEMATRLGFDTSRYKPELGLALGQGEVTPAEMAEMMAAIANGGLSVETRPVFSAVDAAGRERLAPPPAPKRVLSVETAALLRELLRLVVDGGTGGTVRGAGGEGGYYGQALGKTGTTDGEKDLWFAGATPAHSAAVWLGYDKPAGLAYSASDLAAPIWGWWFGRTTKLEGTPPAFPEQPKLTRRVICNVTGKLARPTCLGLSAPFLPGTEPKAVCDEDHVELGPPRPEAQADAGGTARPHHESLWKKLARENAAPL